MQFGKFKRSLTDATSSINLMWAVIIIMAIALTLLSWRALFPESRTIIQPMTLTDPAWVTRTSASTGYKEAMALMYAELLGNVSPANIDFIKERIEPLLSPSIRQDVLNTLGDQAQTIRTENVSVTFVPSSVHYEHETGKYFVEGHSTTIGPNGGSEEEKRTFEFEFEISNYLPKLISLNNYAGRAWTQKRLKQQKARDERRRG